jgi:hypothetical protein
MDGEKAYHKLIRGTAAFRISTSTQEPDAAAPRNLRARDAAHRDVDPEFIRALESALGG